MKKNTLALTLLTVVFLVSASVQTPMGQTTGAQPMVLGDSLFFDINNYMDQFTSAFVENVDDTTGQTLANHTETGQVYFNGSGYGELFTVETFVDSIAGAVRGETFAQSGSFMNFTWSDWENFSGVPNQFGDSFSQPLDGMNMPFEDSFYALYNSTYTMIFPEMQEWMIPVFEVDGIDEGAPLIDESLGSIFDRALYNSLSLTSRNVTFVGDIVTITSSFDLSFNVSGISIGAGGPMLPWADYPFDIEAYLYIDFEASFNSTTGILLDFTSTDYFNVRFSATNVSLPAPPPGLLSLDQTSPLANIFIEKSSTQTTNVIVTDLNFGPDRVKPGVDPNYVFAYGDQIVFNSGWGSGGAATSAIYDGTSGQMMNYFGRSDYSNGWGNTTLFTAFTEPPISINSLGLTQSSVDGITFFGAKNTYQVSRDGNEQHGFRDPTGSFVWDNSTWGPEYDSEVNYNIIEIPYNSTHAMIGGFEDSVDVFDFFGQDDGHDKMPFLDLIAGNSVVPLTSTMSYDYYWNLFVNGFENYWINATDVTAEYTKNWNFAVTDAGMLGIPNLISANLNAQIAFSYFVTFTYDRDLNIIVGHFENVWLDIYVSGSGSVDDGNGNSIPIDIDFTFNVWFNTYADLMSIPVFYQTAPTFTPTDTYTYNDTYTPTNETTPLNETTPANDTTPAGTTSQPALPLPGFGFYATLTGALTVTSVVIIRRRRV